MKGKRVPRKAIIEVARVLNEAGVDEKLVEAVVSALQFWPPPATGSKIFRSGIKREPGRLYYISREGNVMSREQKMEPDETGALVPGDADPEIKPRLELELKLERKPGHLYFLDSDGDVCATAMRRSGGTGS